MADKVFCSQCGTSNDASGRFCQKCGTSLWAGAAAVPAAVAAPAPAPAGNVQPVLNHQFAGQFAGFWIRFLALIIDVIIIRIASLPLLAILGLQHMVWFRKFNHSLEIEDIILMVTALSTVIAIIFLLHWLYEALLTSSPWQGTVGKHLLGLRVTDDFGNRISFARATGRYFSKIISAMICYIGFIMAAFTDRKKALHDMIAGTVVVKGTPGV